MALSDEIREERKKLKGKGPKAYWEYFWEYYKLPAFGIIFGIFFVVSMTKTILTSKDTGFGAIFINPAMTDYAMYDDSLAALAEDYAAFAGIDTKEYNINLDLSEYLTLGFPGGEQDYAVLMKITTQTAAHEVDVMVADAFYFWYYARNSMFLDLREVYTEEELAALPGELYYMDAAENRERMQAYEEDPSYMEDFPTTEEAAAFENPDTFVLPDPSGMREPVPYGIVVTDAPFIEKEGFYPGAVSIYGVVAGSERLEAAKSFLSYMYR